MRAAHITVIALALLYAVGGCASVPFVNATRQYGPAAADRLKDYAENDTTIDTATKADRLAAADELKTATTANIITLESVRSAWDGVRETLAGYYDVDPYLDPNERGLLAGNIARFSRAIEVEGKRWIYGWTNGE